MGTSLARTGKRGTHRTIRTARELWNEEGDEFFGDDDEEGGSGRKKREYGQEGDLDELDFEEDFADDEEKAEPDAEDEEAKEIEVGRLRGPPVSFFADFRNS